MAEKSCMIPVPTMILACAGGSNVGQLTNQAAVELAQEGFGKLSCLAGIGAHLDGFVQSAMDIQQLVVIDGCDMACAHGVLEQAEIPVEHYLVVTDLGIKKNSNMNLIREEVAQVKQAVRDLFSSNTSGEIASSGNVCSCPIMKK